MPARRSLFRGAWLIVAILLALSLATRTYAQPAKSDAGKKAEPTKKGDAAKSAGVRKVEAPKSAETPKAEATSTQDATGKPDPIGQLSRQYKRRSAAKSKEREAEAKTPPPANEIHEPVVALSQRHRDSCVVFLGDKMPAGTLPDVSGPTHDLLASLGKQLTVVVFWNANNPYALDQFQEMQHELIPLAEEGVQAVAIHVGEPPEDYAKLCAENAEGALCLLDGDRSYFALVAHSKLPRTYLLDAQGTIVWLDLEYSRSTRYDLRNAIHFYLQK